MLKIFMMGDDKTILDNLYTLHEFEQEQSKLLLIQVTKCQLTINMKRVFHRMFLV